MSVLTAALTLAWGCLAVLTLAMAGMLRQLRALQTEVVALRSEQGMQPWRAGSGPVGHLGFGHAHCGYPAGARTG